MPFVLVYLALYYSWQLFSGWLVGRQSGGVKTGRAEWTKKIAVSCALVIVFTLVLGSLGQLTWRDTITLLILFAVGCFYILRMAKRT